MAFTDVEMAILSQLAYCGADKEKKSSPPIKGENLYDFISRNEKYLSSKLGDNYADAIDGLLTKVKDGYTIAHKEDDKYGTGFAAFAIKDPNNEITVACRGTEGFHLFDGSDDDVAMSSLKDVLADAELALSISTAQHEAMEKFMQELAGYDGYYFTGHSLGGNVAYYGAVTMTPIDKVKGVVTFNAPGFNEAFISRYAAEIALLYNRTKLFQNEKDIVSSLLHPTGQVIIVDDCEGNDHSLNSLTISNDSYSHKEKQVKSVKANAIHETVEFVRTITGVRYLNFLIGFFEIGIEFGEFAVSLYKKVSNWVKDLFSGKNADTYGSFIHVDTGSLRAYADRLIKANNRISKLDQRLDALYTQVGLRDLFKLIEVDALTGYSWRLNKCINYLNDTAADFESIERAIANQI